MHRDDVHVSIPGVKKKITFACSDDMGNCFAAAKTFVICAVQQSYSAACCYGTKCLQSLVVQCTSLFLLLTFIIIMAWKSTGN